jgi:hypothetical protein
MTMTTTTKSRSRKSKTKQPENVFAVGDTVEFAMAEGNPKPTGTAKILVADKIGKGYMYSLEVLAVQRGEPNDMKTPDGELWASGEEVFPVGTLAVAALDATAAALDAVEDGTNQNSETEPGTPETASGGDTNESGGSVAAGDESGAAGPDSAEVQPAAEESEMTAVMDKPAAKAKGKRKSDKIEHVKSGVSRSKAKREGLAELPENGEKIFGKYAPWEVIRNLKRLGAEPAGVKKILKGLGCSLPPSLVDAVYWKDTRPAAARHTPKRLASKDVAKIRRDYGTLLGVGIPERK